MLLFCRLLAINQSGINKQILSVWNIAKNCPFCFYRLYTCIKLKCRLRSFQLFPEADLLQRSKCCKCLISMGVHPLNKSSRKELLKTFHCLISRLSFSCLKYLSNISPWNILKVVISEALYLIIVRAFGSTQKLTGHDRKEYFKKKRKGFKQTDAPVSEEHTVNNKQFLMHWAFSLITILSASW